jgi:hypothetical protein
LKGYIVDSSVAIRRAKFRALFRVRGAIFFVVIALCGCSKQTEITSAEKPSNAKAVGSVVPNSIGTISLSAAQRDAYRSKLCNVLNELAPKAPQLTSIGTQAQLVMSIASAFDANPAALQWVSAEVDVVAAASCSGARDALLKVLKVKSLQEAVR